MSKHEGAHDSLKAEVVSVGALVIVLVAEVRGHAYHSPLLSLIQLGVHSSLSIGSTECGSCSGVWGIS